MTDPAGISGNHSAADSGKFLNAFFPGEALTFTISGTAAAFYEVRDYNGNIVVANTVIPGSRIVTLPALPLGWYKMYLIRAADFGVPWFFSGGELCFCVVRSSSPLLARPSNPAIAYTVETNDFGQHYPARGFFGLGPGRHKIDDLTTLSPTAANMASSITYELSNRTTDSARPFKPMVAHPNGYAGQSANLTSVVQQAVAAAGGQVFFEGMNEPNVGLSVATYATQQNAFAAVVHAAHANAKVIGPGTLSICGDAIDAGGPSLNWINGILPLVGANLDGISFHNYDNPGGNLSANRAIFDRWVAVLNANGQGSKPRWNTEFGSTYAVASGAFMPHVQARLVMLDLHVHEQYLIPKENTSLFYDNSHGFWGFPSFWVMREYSPGQVTPLGPLMRVWAEELWGRNFSTKLDFGSENDLYIGSRFTGSDGTSRVIVQSGGGHSGLITFAVTGAATITKSDCWGTLTTLNVSGGTFTDLITGLPTYYRAPSGVTITPVAVNYGVETVKGTYATITATQNSSTAYKAGDTILDALGPQPFPRDTYWDDWVATSGSVTWQINWAKKTRFNKVVPTCPYPTNAISTMTDFDVQALGVFTPGVWQTIATWTFDPATNQVLWTSTNDAGGCYVDNWYDFQTQFPTRFDPALEADGLRIVCRKTTYGGRPTPECWNRQFLQITGNPTGGTFTLTFNGNTTAAIQRNATPAQVLAALQAATGGSIWVTVQGTTLAGGIALTATLPSQLTRTNNLTGGTAPDAVISQPGSSNPGGDMFLGGPQVAQIREVQVYLNEYDLGKANSPNAPFFPAIV